MDLLNHKPLTLGIIIIVAYFRTGFFDGTLIYQMFKFVEICTFHLNLSPYFCSTSLSLASARWVRLTLSSHCLLLEALLSIKVSNIKSKNSWGCRELYLRLMGEKQEAIMLPLCFAAPLGWFALNRLIGHSSVNTRWLKPTYLWSVWLPWQKGE